MNTYDHLSRLCNHFWLHFPFDCVWDSNSCRSVHECLSSQVKVHATTPTLCVSVICTSTQCVIVSVSLSVHILTQCFMVLDRYRGRMSLLYCRICITLTHELRELPASIFWLGYFFFSRRDIISPLTSMSLRCFISSYFYSHNDAIGLREFFLGGLPLNHSWLHLNHTLAHGLLDIGIVVLSSPAPWSIKFVWK